MRLILTWATLSVLTLLVLPGCSRNAQDAIVKDINNAAKEVDRAFTH